MTKNVVEFVKFKLIDIDDDCHCGFIVSQAPVIEGKEPAVICLHCGGWALVEDCEILARQKINVSKFF